MPEIIIYTKLNSYTFEIRKSLKLCLKIRHMSSNICTFFANLYHNTNMKISYS